MEGDPHRVIEGMMLAGYAIGANEDIIRQGRIPLAVKRLRNAVETANKYGMLGENILAAASVLRLT